ncbi:MAG: short-chain dehydrogenase/reductase [Proteobacteria bacterium]|nr:short-chain dehydrogenase/reductase [Pseudomonadota bacterium]
MDFGLTGKTALITGGSKGIGYAVAESLAAEGCNLILAARTAADLATASEKLRSRHNVSIETHALDLSKSEDIAKLASACPDIDILVNNAGAIPSASLDQLDEARWREAWDLKLFGFINLTRLVYAAMKERGSGVIVNVIGNSAGLPKPNYIAGGAANSALDAFTVALGKESPAHGIRVLGMHPGVTRTERQAVRFYERAEKELGDRERWAELLPPLPFDRPTEPEEVGDFVAFLASDRAAYTSGVVMNHTPPI